MWPFSGMFWPTEQWFHDCMEFFDFIMVLKAKHKIVLIKKNLLGGLEVWIYFLVVKTIFYLLAAFVLKTVLQLPLKNKIHISAPSCNISNVPWPIINIFWHSGISNFSLCVSSHNWDIQKKNQKQKIEKHKKHKISRSTFSGFFCFVCFP